MLTGWMVYVCITKKEKPLQNNKHAGVTKYNSKNLPINNLLNWVYNQCGQLKILDYLLDGPPQLVSGLVHPIYNCTNPAYPYWGITH